MNLEISWLKGFRFLSITFVWTKLFPALDRGRGHLWAYMIRDNDVASASFHLRLHHWRAPCRRWRKWGKRFQSYSFSVFLPSPHSQRSWEAHPSHFPPLPRPFLYPRSSPCADVLSDQQNRGFPTRLGAVLPRVFTSCRPQHEGYSEARSQVPFFLRKWIIFH